MSRDPRLYLNDIAESIQDIENYTQGMAEEDFRASRLVQDAVVRRLEIIGEAARQLPAPTKERYSSIPWRRIAGLRNRWIRAGVARGLYPVRAAFASELQSAQREADALALALSPAAYGSG